MAIKSKDELMNAIRSKLGDGTDDESIAFLEDVTDTLNDYESKANGDGTDWKTKFEENDATWRQRYHDRFFNSSASSDDPDPYLPEPKPEPKDYSYEHLFSDGKE